VKSNPGTAEKISIEEIESLLKSILVKHNLTEKQLCIQLSYKKGYISQLRSREKKTGKPQISPKFYDKLRSYELQNANQANPESEPNITDPHVTYNNNDKGLLSKGENKFIIDLLAEKERAIKKAEEYGKKMESYYEEAVKEKAVLTNIISKTLKEISRNFSALTAILRNNQTIASGQLKDQGKVPAIQKGKVKKKK